MITPDISVVIPTFNRCATLEKTLSCLAQQTLHPDRFEVLVIDDGSRDETEAIVARAADGFRFPLRYFKHENRGPGYTQNRGIRLARSPLVLLLPDDMWATPQLLEEHIAGHRTEPADNVAILGQVVESAQLPSTQLHRHWDPFGFKELAGRRELTPLHFWACNLSVHRDFLLAHGLFLERQGAANEDLELGFRLQQHGLRVLYHPAALTHHYHVETIDTACRRAYQQGHNFDTLDSVPVSVLYPFCGLFTLHAGLPYAVTALPRALVRTVLFNYFFVRKVWMPILRHADRSVLARAVARRAVYRAVVGSHCRAGIKAIGRQHRR